MPPPVGISPSCRPPGRSEETSECPARPCGWSGHSAQRFWSLTCPGLMTSNFRPQAEPLSAWAADMGCRLGVWDLRSPVTMSTCPSSSRDSGGFGLPAWDCCQLSSSKSSTRLTAPRSGHQPSRPPGWSQKWWGRARQGVLRPHQAPEAGPRGARAEGQGWAERGLSVGDAQGGVGRGKGLVTFPSTAQCTLGLWQQQRCQPGRQRPTCPGQIGSVGRAALGRCLQNEGLNCHPPGDASPT